MKVITCTCGIKTTEPFLVNGVLLCAICVEEFAPRLVQRRAVDNWTAFSQMNRKVPTSHLIREYLPKERDGHNS